MKKSALTPLFFALLATLSLAGCGHKDESFAREMDGLAQPVDQRTIDEGTAANDKNIKLDFTRVDEPIYSNEGGGTGVTVHSVIKVNDVARDLWTNHWNPKAGYSAYSAGDTQINGMAVRVISSCADGGCGVYYIMAEVYMSGQLVHQLGLKYDFKSGTNRSYTIRTKAPYYGSYDEFVAFMNNPSNFN